MVFISFQQTRTNRRISPWRSKSFPAGRRMVHALPMTPMSTARIHAMPKNGVRSPQRTKRPAAALKIREASFDDYQAITALQERNGLATRSREQWQSLWMGNPVYERMHGNWPIGWVLQADEGVVG